MKPRLIILLVVAAGAAIYWASQLSAPQRTITPPDPTYDDPNVYKTVPQQEIECEEPDVEPSLSVTFHLDSTGNKNRVYFQISEENGFYVDYLTLQAWYKTRPETELEQSRLHVTHIVNDFIAANETYEGCFEVTGPELARVPGQVMGTVDNWEVEVVNWYRVCLEDPPVLPTVVKGFDCE